MLHRRVKINRNDRLWQTGSKYDTLSSGLGSRVRRSETSSRQSVRTYFVILIKLRLRRKFVPKFQYRWVLLCHNRTTGETVRRSGGMLEYFWSYGRTPCFEIVQELSYIIFTGGVARGRPANSRWPGKNWWTKNWFNICKPLHCLWLFRTSLRLLLFLMFFNTSKTCLMLFTDLMNSLNTNPSLETYQWFFRFFDVLYTCFRSTEIFFHKYMLPNSEDLF